MPLWDGTIKRCSLAECKLLEAHESEVMHLGKGVQSQWCFFRQIDALNFMQAAISSQYKLINRGVTCILFGTKKIDLTATFWVNCKGLIELAGRPAKRALQ